MILICLSLVTNGFPGGTVVKNPTTTARDLREKKKKKRPKRHRFKVRKISWSRKWHSTPALLPGKSHGQRSLLGYSPRGHNVSDMTE